MPPSLLALFLLGCGGFGTGLNHPSVSCPEGRTLLDGVCVSESVADYVACVRAQGAQLGGAKQQQISADVGTVGVKASAAAQVSENLEKKYAASDATMLEIVKSCNASAGSHATGAPVAPSGGGSSPGPWIVGGIGLAALAAGGVTGGLVLSKKSTFDASVHECSLGKTCVTPEGDSARSAVNTLGPVTTASLIIGGVGIAAAGLWLGLRTSGKSSASFGVGPVAGGAAWRVEGSW
jgi:hypothetical protein